MATAIETPEVLTIASTNVIELTGMKDRVTKLYPVDATVSCELLDSAGVAVSGASSISMSYVAGTAGAATMYRGTIPHTVTLTEAATYTARITATSNSIVRRFDVPCVAAAG